VCRFFLFPNFDLYHFNMKNSFRLFILILGMGFFSLMPQDSVAWGLNGHRIVGEIASTHLTKKARKAVKAILGDESIAMSSNWPDFIKSDPAYKKYYNWHFINLEAGFTNDSIMRYLDADTAVDAYTKINFLIDQLKHHELSQSVKKEYLKLLIHIVGDIHQPLHVGHYSDLGGNRIRLKWFHDSSNLHQVWDERLVDFQLLSYTEFSCAINHIKKEQAEKWGKMTLQEWICDSYNIAQEIYNYAETQKGSLRYEYNYRYLSVLNEQLLKGGFHLAQILNDIFG